jgi:putative ABC transport system ATP-binding protein
VVEGQDLGTLTDNQKTEHRARRMGFIFQFYNLLPVLTATENVELPLLLSGTAPKVAMEKALNALELVNMRDRGDHRPAELSGGERQRATIARALVNDPAIVFADEPTGDLDKENSLDVMRLMIRLNRERKQTFIIVTHDTKLGKMAPRQIFMENGKIKSDTGARR